MATSDATGVRHVRCPRCHSLLQEPGDVPVYQCGGCGASLRAKNSSGQRRDVASSSASPSTSRRLGTGSTDVARTSEQRVTGTTSLYESGDLVSARKHGSGDGASTSSTPDNATSSRRQETSDLVSARNHGSSDDSEFPSQRDTDDAERNAVSHGVSVSFGGGAKDQAPSELRQVDSEWRRRRRRKGQAELPDAARKKHSGEAAVQPPQLRDRQELAPKSVPAAESQPSPDAPAAVPRHEIQAEDLAPLRQKILKTVDELKGDLSELFSKSPDINPATRARPPRLPKQEGYASSTLPARAPRAAAVVNHHGSAARTVKPGRQAAAAPRRGLPSRRYRRCRADPCCENVPGRACRHGCWRHHAKPECSSCRGRCGSRPTRAHQEPSAPRMPPAAKEAKPPRHHCLPVLKGAPFIICSSCFRLVQVPAHFAVSTNRLPKLRCGYCSAVLRYSYRDPARKKLQDSIDQSSTDGSEVRGGKGYAQPDPFVDDFGLSSYSTEDEQPLHASRNTSFDTVDGVKGVGRLHRLMGCGSASALRRHSPDRYLYESVDERTTPDYDRKGKGVCIDAEEDDSDDEDSCVSKRGAVWPLPGMLGKGVPRPGAIRIKS